MYLKCVYVILLTAIIREAKGKFSWGPKNVNPNDPLVQGAVDYIYKYVKENNVINSTGPATNTVISPPINVTGTVEIVSGALYNLSFEVLVTCKECAEQDKQIPKLFGCKGAVVEQVWKPVKYTWFHGTPKCYPLLLEQNKQL